MIQEEDVMKWENHIVINPKIMVGKPIIKGTRLTVEFIIDLLAQDWKEEDILQNYPGLTHENIQACLAYARDMLSRELIYETPVLEQGRQ